ncbi:TetR/AcrR family transcriptional regulator C-terminal ligand-binding domain-containing protein [Frankia sp. CNm7]|uniref:TetR/AcrR family transcriptional regulator C-terminal ligand-binding domain-containing protein n=2 Tax=Frankia nepalensis TaxID=1836974 RepID=A0A937UKS9_9ACTN|nr:TetR-like C-terminal domain-containing protein [Frankia nepalensis]MBL7495771.1 TetR/AcrR family transcriptional regulator C-terminal ligand-binding domain-containing protein [Frankia nepalensis]MBL7513014.1 TetR/AcrR family transcriptional regulator C-terminal ligand-binding domain-containing protein [Frankia nepalensis]MBL7523636.1 TetR/AcrR family transcriptional regulator C-terminal ligand-binding domain-containing protein [Frankia nepalensis]MBL7627119.1 TetR/AcrR family transcriptional
MLTTMEPAAARPRGRPRDPALDDRVLAAAVAELAERGVAEFSLTSVAARARAAKRSIYARWPTREDLMLAGMSTLAAGLVPPRTGSLEQDMDILLDRVAAVFTEPRLTLLQRCVAEISQYPDLYAAFKRDSVDRCLAAVEDAVHDAVARGEIRADIDRATVAEALVGIAMLRGAFAQPTGSPILTSRQRTEVIRMFLDGLRPRP